MMEVSVRRMRNLKPARPLRRITLNQEVQTDAVERTTESKKNMMKMEHFYKILNLHSQSQEPVKAERISYSRDFLIRLANSPMAKKKPDFLPDHPVILDKGRNPQGLFGNSFAKWNMVPET